MARRSEKGAKLTIPRITGLSAISGADVTVFSMTGRELVKETVPLNRYASTSLNIATGKGAFIAKVSVRGISIGTAKIIVP